MDAASLQSNISGQPLDNAYAANEICALYDASLVVVYEEGVQQTISNLIRPMVSGEHE